MDSLEALMPYLKDEKVLIGATAVVAAIGIKLLSKKTKRPPGPPVWPIVGSLPNFTKDISFFSDLAEKYGDIAYLEMGLFGNNPTYVISSIELIREALLQKQDDVAGRFRTHTTDITSFNGASIVAGDYSPRWKFQRKIAHAALRKYASGSHFEELLEHSFNNISDAFRKSNEQPINIKMHITLLIYNIVASMCFGKKYDLNDPEFVRLRSLFEMFADDFSAGGTLADMIPALSFIPTPLQRKMRYIFSALIDFISGHINEHKENFDKNDVRDLTYFLLQIHEEMMSKGQNEGVRMEDVNFLMTISDMFFAGTETTLTTLNWALMFVAANPEVQKKAQEEIDEKIGREGRITTTNRVNIPYCEAIIYETLRLRSPVPLAVPHKALVDTTIGGYDVPKGTQVFINLVHLHYNPKTWVNPKEFRPERFIDEKGNLAPKPDSFLPFSTGRRQCVGEAIAKMELHILLGMLLQKFTFQPQPGKKIILEPKEFFFGYPMQDNEIIIKER